MIRRHPDIKLLRRPDDIDAFAATQRRILRTAFELLRPGGRLIYCTCSVLPAENERWSRPSWRRSRAPPWPAGPKDCAAAGPHRTHRRLAAAARWRCGHRWLLLCLPPQDSQHGIMNECIPTPRASLSWHCCSRRLAVIGRTGRARRCARWRARSALGLCERRAGRVPAVRARGLPGQRRHPRGAQGRTDAHLRPRRGGDARAPLLDGRDGRRVHAAARAQLPRGQRPVRHPRRRHAQRRAAQLRHARGSARGARHRGCLAVSCCRRSCRPTAQYRVSLRAGVRRGRLPDTLRVLLFWTDDWHRESEWFSWSLQR